MELDPSLTRSMRFGGISNLALLAPIKAGLVPGAEIFTYAQRLQALLGTVHGLGLGSRESALVPAVFPNSVGRWDLLQSFRYAVVPPRLLGGSDTGSGSEPKPGTHHVYLNVTFDAGWEPYIRVIYRDLGRLLDTILGNCVGYTPSYTAHFEDYVLWVRQHEVPSGLLYTESSTTVLDQRYLKVVEKIQRESRDPIHAKRAIAQFALQPTPDEKKVLSDFYSLNQHDKELTVVDNVSALRALFDLRECYPANRDKDDLCLLRFVQSVMPEFRTLVRMELLPRIDEFPRIAPYRAALQWLAQEIEENKPAPGPAKIPQDDVQAGILSGFGTATRGWLVLLGVSDASHARDYLSKLKITTQTDSVSGCNRYCNIAFTRHGLQALNIARDPKELARWPQEFIEGMEARAGLLGDIHSNHPDNWERPRYRDSDDLDLRAVHVVIQYRATPDQQADDDFRALCTSIEHPTDGIPSGLRLLAVEKMESRRAELSSGDKVVRTNAGFADGLSQPFVGRMPPGKATRDKVSEGELLLGYANDRQDVRSPANPSLLDNGTFLVLRKIKENLPALEHVLTRAAKARNATYDLLGTTQQQAARTYVLERMMGRTLDGVPLADPGARGNDFDYAADPAGALCPFAAHIRRTNPRSPHARTPRILRRGASYGPTQPDGEIGIYFMAYCASIAEQFEVVQRWITGGNSTGILSDVSDPFLGVPVPGVRRSFEWVEPDGELVHVDLGSEPLTKLQWGLYLFVPSIKFLGAMAQDTFSVKPDPEPATQPAPGTSPATAADQDDLSKLGEPRNPSEPEFNRYQHLFRDSDMADEAWAYYKDRPEKSNATAYGNLIVKMEPTLEVLKDDGKVYSASGYGRRFAKSVGAGFLGMDDWTNSAAMGHQTQAVDSGVSAAIAAITEAEAFAIASINTRKAIEQLLASASPGVETYVDLIDLAEDVIARLYKHWFGLPDVLPDASPDEAAIYMGSGRKSVALGDVANDPALCPRDFMFVAQYIFQPYPEPSERYHGILRGQSIRSAVDKYWKDTKNKGLQPGPLTVEIATRLQDMGDDIIVNTIAGVMLGFGPGIIANFTNVMEKWGEHSFDGTPNLWDLQTALKAYGQANPGVAVDGFDAALAQLRAPLIRQLRRAISPGVLFREVQETTPNESLEPTQEKTILGIHGLVQDENVDECLMFGGAMRSGVTPQGRFETRHACPGKNMAIGIMLGLLSAILLSGRLRPTGSPWKVKVVR